MIVKIRNFCSFIPLQNAAIGANKFAKNAAKNNHIAANQLLYDVFTPLIWVIFEQIIYLRSTFSFPESSFG